MFVFQNKKESGGLNGCDKDIAAEAERLDVKDKGPLILVELLFDNNILTQIKQHRILFLRVLYLYFIKREIRLYLEKNYAFILKFSSGNTAILTCS